MLCRARSTSPADPTAPGGPWIARRLWLTHAGVLGGAGLLGLAGCASPPKPTKIAATLVADAGLNPDLRKRASPLVLRIYELRSTASFDAADFLSLYERDQATLGAELVARDELVLKPGETRSWDKTPGPDTRFIGMFGAFRNLEQARWKAAVALVPQQANVLSATLEPLALTLRRVSP